MARSVTNALRPNADLAIGFGLGLAAYLMFSKVLTLSLPTGPIERLF
jgi:putative tricarboxylic transport membrane protein